MYRLKLLIAVGVGFVVLVVSLAGCGGSSPSTEPKEQGPTTKDALDELATMLRSIAEDKKKPPARPADLTPYEPVFLSATLGIQQNRIVYAWGSGLTGGQAVIAYDPVADTAGGYVLLQNGTVKQMSTEEFKAAPKAQGFKTGAGKK